MKPLSIILPTIIQWTFTEDKATLSYSDGVSCDYPIKSWNNRRGTISLYKDGGATTEALIIHKDGYLFDQQGEEFYPKVELYCSYEGCENTADFIDSYCRKHTCSLRGCYRVIYKGGPYCIRHTCVNRTEGCHNMVMDSSEKCLSCQEAEEEAEARLCKNDSLGVRIM